MTNDFNKTMERINNQLIDELCNKLSNPKYLTEFTSVSRYDNVKNMLDSLTSDFINTSLNNFDYSSYASYLDTLDGFVDLDSIGLDEPIFILDHNGEILDADTDYFNIIFYLGFEDNLNKDGKQVLKDYEELSELLNQFENDKEMDTLEMIEDYATDWYTIDDFSLQLEKYVENDQYIKHVTALIDQLYAFVFTVYFTNMNKFLKSALQVRFIMI